MNYVENLGEKLQIVRNQFEPLIGKQIVGYELGEVWCEEGTWSEWMDLPLFLKVGDKVISISWRKLDELAIERGRVLPFSLGDSVVRWQSEGVPSIEPAIGRTISTVSLGRGEMSIEDREVEIWTRLLIGFKSGEVLEVFNVFDENGIDFHTIPIGCESKKCI